MSLGRLNGDQDDLITFVDEIINGPTVRAFAISE